MAEPLRKRGGNSQLPLYGSSGGIDNGVELLEKPGGGVNILKRIEWSRILVIACVWSMIMFHFQRIKPRGAIRDCEWSKWEEFGGDKSVFPHRVLLIADPQLVDAHTYPKRPGWIQYVTAKISDNYMANNYKLLQEQLEPDSTIFLGDLFDGGREWHDDAVWYAEWKRFNRIFPAYPNRRFYLNILGNHDAGWDKTMNRTIVDRFKVIFGDSNDHVNIGNHTFLFLDTIALSATNNNDSSIYQEARDYFDRLTAEYLPAQDSVQRSKGEPLLPRVLLTHVPFFRDPRAQPCRGPREHKKPFPLVNGGTFQTVLFPDLTNELLSKLQPDIIFSGDDHDYCEVDHVYSATHRSIHSTFQKKSTEITVKSFSMNMGVNYPAAQLLSLYNPLNQHEAALNPNKKTFQTQICYPYAPFPTLYTYAALLLFTLIFWVLFKIYPLTYLSVEQKACKVAQPAIQFIIQRVPFLRFCFAHSNNGKKYNKSKVSFGFLPQEQQLNHKNLQNRDYAGFAANFALQLAAIYLVFVYYFVTV